MSHSHQKQISVTFRLQFHLKKHQLVTFYAIFLFQTMPQTSMTFLFRETRKSFVEEYLEIFLLIIVTINHIDFYVIAI